MIAGEAVKDRTLGLQAQTQHTSARIVGEPALRSRMLRDKLNIERVLIDVL